MIVLWKEEPFASYDTSYYVVHTSYYQSDTWTVSIQSEENLNESVLTNT